MEVKWTPEQRKAMELDGKTMLVSAAAGSGKTKVLTGRIIRLLTEKKEGQKPADLSRMLIVTFTRASAADLKAKVATALTEALAKNPGDPHLTKQLLNLGSAQISTIDSFFQRIVRANFDELNLPASFRITDQTEVFPLCLQVLNEVIEEHYKKNASGTANDPLSRVRDNPFADAMDHLISGRSDETFEPLILNFYNKFQSYPEGIKLLHTCAKTLCDQAHDEYFTTACGASLHQYITEKFTSYLHFVDEIIALLEPAPDFWKTYSGLLSSDRDFCSRVLAALGTASYTEVRDIILNFTPKKPHSWKQFANDTTDQYRAWREVFKEGFSEIKQAMQWPAEALPEQFERTAALCEALYLFYADYEAKLLVEKKARGILEHNDIRALLYHMLTDENGNPSPAAKAIAAQYDSVYIDEYQDVDLLQDRIFSRIGENNRFMVGDIKQSIYVFRGSEPSVFAGYRQRFPLYTDEKWKSADGVCVFMSNNFRCDEPVVNFTNKICAFLFSACEKSIKYRKEDDLVFSKKREKKEEPVHVAVFEKKPPKNSKNAPVQEDDESTEGEKVFTAEQTWVANEICRLLHTKWKKKTYVSPSDIVILVQTKKIGVGFARALEAIGVPVVAEAADNLMHDPLMVDLLNLLQTIDNPHRDLPLSEYLQSSIEGFCADELYRLRTELPKDVSLYDALVAKAEADDDSPLCEKSKRFVEWLEPYRESAAALSADRFLRQLYHDPKLNRYQGEAPLLFLYEQARTYQKAAFCGLYQLLDAMETLQNNKDVAADGFKKAKKAVRIMTIHHSKGLEFPIVFLCGVGSKFIKKDVQASLVFHRNVGCASKLYNPVTGESEETVLRLSAKNEVEAEQKEESIRTLYVALTRASRKLYVTGTMPKKRDEFLPEAQLIRRGERSTILGSETYLSWILAAIYEKGHSTDDSYFTLDFYPYTPATPVQYVEPTSDTDEEDEEDAEEEKKESTTVPCDVERYAKILSTKKDFQYPLAFLSDLPTKAAASKLSPNLLDQIKDDKDEEKALELQLSQMLGAQPSFDEKLLSSKKPTAAQIGTANHAFLEFCDFKLLAQNGVDAECQRLLDCHFLSNSDAELLDRTQLEAFKNSSIMDEILAAKKVRREQKFNLFVPFSELTQKSINEQLSEHSLFVQGSIDLLIETLDGELILVDYKTDRPHEEEWSNPALFHERMRTAHGSQLYYYQRAVSELFSKLPDKTYLYSLPFGKAFEM